MTQAARDMLNSTRWGSHFCQFFKTGEDLTDIRQPFFKAGLEKDAFCMWIVSEPLSEELAKETLRRAVPDFDQYLSAGRMEIVPHTEWYLKDGVFNLQRVVAAWTHKFNQALARGYDGMRVAGNTSWLDKRDWGYFAEYEEKINDSIGTYPTMAMCSYPLDRCEAPEIIDVVRNHHYAFIKRDGRWECVEHDGRRRTREELEKVLEGDVQSARQWQQTFDASVDMIAFISPDFEIMKINQAGCKLAGMSPDEIIGKKCYRAIHKLDGPIDDCMVVEAKKTKKAGRGEVTHHGRHYIAMVSPVFDKNDELLGFSHSMKDITRRKRAERALRNSEKKFLEQNVLLQEKNIVLKELMGHVQTEKERIEDQVVTNVNRLVLPLLARLRNGSSTLDMTYIDLLEQNLKQIISPFGREMSGNRHGLTPKEIEICSMLRSGLSSKEIACLLNTSFLTVEKHRRNVRKKLGLTNTKLNLTTYLQSLQNSTALLVYSLVFMGMSIFHTHFILDIPLLT